MADARIKAIQQTLTDAGLYTGSVDGSWGPLSQGAMDRLIHGLQFQSEDGKTLHDVIATSFADPSDVEAFTRCKARGGTDQDCFRVGDNGIGKWGDDCTGPKPMCALPPEDWQEFSATARGKLVAVTANGKTVICELRDTMPHRKNITNGAGIDLSPAAIKAFGLRPPARISATWKWVGWRENR